MVGIIIACTQKERADSIRRVLRRNGYHVFGVCSSGAGVLQLADRMETGIVIGEYQLSDMMFAELRGLLPGSFEMLLAAPVYKLVDNQDCAVMSLSVPFQNQELLSTVSLMVDSMENKKNNKKVGKEPTNRKPKERKLLNEAKALLMSRKNMTEEDTHRYIQKYSMDHSTSLQETAQRILSAVK